MATRSSRPPLRNADIDVPPGVATGLLTGHPFSCLAHGVPALYDSPQRPFRAPTRRTDRAPCPSS